MPTTRKIVRISEEKCDGCGQCVTACAEGAIQMIDGKARLVSDTYCDGLGACLGDCPQGAITVEERLADPFDEAAVARHLQKLGRSPEPRHPHFPSPPSPGPACPGSAMRSLRMAPPVADAPATPAGESSLGHWPIQLMLVPPRAPFLRSSDLLVCADCVPFVVPDFHQRYLAGRAVLVGCPKLDDLEHYREKLREIVAQARPRRLTVLRMEVPCCGGIANAAVQAAILEAPDLPVEVHTIGIQGGIHTAARR